MGFLFVILGTLMWSLDTLIRYPLLATLRPDTMVFLEHLFLVMIFVPLLFLRKARLPLQKNTLVPFLVIGVLGSAISTLAFTRAFVLINPSLVILLQKLQPLVVISLSSLVLKEKIRPRFFIWATLAILGGALISYPDIHPLFTANTNLPAGATCGTVPMTYTATFGYALTLLAVLGWGASTVFGKKLTLQGLDENQILLGRFGFGFLFLFFYCLSFGSLPTLQLGTEAYLKVLGMVLISGLLGMWLYYRGLKQLPAHIASLAELFFPFSAVLINWIFLDKALVPIQIAGAVLLTAASIGVQRRSTT